MSLTVHRLLKIRLQRILLWKLNIELVVDSIIQFGVIINFILLVDLTAFMRKFKAGFRLNHFFDLFGKGVVRLNLLQI